MSATAAAARRTRGIGPRLRTRSFAAVLWPGGIELVQYRETRSATNVVRFSRRLAPFFDIEQAAGALAEMVEAEGGRGGSVALALRGFGSFHRFITLPVAEPEVVRPIVERDMAKFDPDMRRPRIAFTRVYLTGEGDSARQELLAAAVPQDVIARLDDALAAREITLRHITLVPCVLQRLYETYVHGQDPAILALLLPGAPVVAAFDHGRPVMVREPPISATAEAVPTPRLAAEMVDRAAFFLRQHGATVGANRVFVAGLEDASGFASFAHDPAAEPVALAAEGIPAGAVTALAAALDAQSDGLNLIARDTRRRPARSSSRLAMALLLPVLAAVAWAVTGLLSERSARATADALDSQLIARRGAFEQVLPTLQARRAYAQRVHVLRGVRHGRDETATILDAISAVSGNAIDIESISVTPDASSDGWRVALAGRATAGGSSAAVRAVNRLYRGLQQRLPVDEISLDRLETLTAAPDANSIAVAFAISFIVVAGKTP